MMSRGQVIYLHVTVALTAVTGAIFAAMKYGMTTDDPFAAANHPLQPGMLSAHVVVAPLLLFALGWIFGDHIWPKYTSRAPHNRRTGVFSMLAIVPMTMSGYLMQVATSDALRDAMTWMHWVASALFVAAYVGHLLAGRRTPTKSR
jgi:hypothetical protein